MSRFYLICIFLFARHLSSAQSLGDSLVQVGNFVGARVAYERDLFETVELSKIDRLLLKKAYCYKAEHNFQDSYATLKRANLLDTTQSTRLAIFYESALLAYLINKSDLALSHLKELAYYYPGTTSQPIELIEILILNDLKSWPEAKAKFGEYSQKYNLTSNTSVYDLVMNHTEKNPSKARVLSMLLPGAGQVYAGYWFKGLTSFLVNGGLILFTTYNFSTGFYLSGAFTGVALFHFFYLGGAEYAYKLTEEKNNERVKFFNQQINQTLFTAK